MKAPVERKVQVGAAGAGIGAALGGLACWAVDTYIHTPAVEGDLPAPLTTAILAVVAGAVAWISAYAARHTPRGNTATIVQELVDAGLDPAVVTAAVNRAGGRAGA